MTTSSWHDTPLTDEAKIKVLRLLNGETLLIPECADPRLFNAARSIGGNTKYKLTYETEFAADDPKQQLKENHPIDATQTLGQLAALLYGMHEPSPPRFLVDGKLEEGLKPEFFAEHDEHAQTYYHRSLDNLPKTIPGWQQKMQKVFDAACKIVNFNDAPALAEMDSQQLKEDFRRLSFQIKYHDFSRERDLSARVGMSLGQLNAFLDDLQIAKEASDDDFLTRAHPNIVAALEQHAMHGEYLKQMARLVGIETEKPNPARRIGPSR